MVLSENFSSFTAVFYIEPRAKKIEFQKLDTIIDAKFDEEFESEFRIV